MRLPLLIAKQSHDCGTHTDRQQIFTTVSFMSLCRKAKRHFRQSYCRCPDLRHQRGHRKESKAATSATDRSSGGRIRQPLSQQSSRLDVPGYCKWAENGQSARLRCKRVNVNKKHGEVNTAKTKNGGTASDRRSTYGWCSRVQ